jgi:hypothetical protein
VRKGAKGKNQERKQVTAENLYIGLNEIRMRMGGHEDEVNASSQNGRDVELVARITSACGGGGSAGNDEGGTRKMMWVCFDLLTFIYPSGFFLQPYVISWLEWDAASSDFEVKS